MSTLYKERLEGRRIRLLEILPGKGDTIDCRLVPADLDSPPSYEALSYVWGDKTDTRIITCDGLSLSVTINLFDALVRLRSVAPRLIWADAICINQYDTKEKDQQVRMMKDVYSAARRVVVWLGKEEEGDNVEDAIMLMNTIYKLSQNRVPDLETLLKTKELWLELSSVTVDDIAIEFTSIAWASMAQLYRRPWFKRIWCVQEVKVAQEAIVLCGPWHVDWDVVGFTAGWILKLQYDIYVKLGLSSTGHIWMMYLKDAGELPLLRALVRFRELKATDPRDKVYAILGLTPEANAVPIDYNSSLGRVFADTAYALIHLRKDLDVLSHVHHHEDYNGSSEFPSWAPRWDEDGISISFQALHILRERWSFSSIQEPSKSETDTLRLSGICFDAATYTSSKMEPHKFKEFNRTLEPHPLVTLWRDIASGLFESTSGSFTKMARTLTTGLTETLHIVEDLALDEQKPFYAEFFAFMKILFQQIEKMPATLDACIGSFGEADPRSHWIFSSSVCESWKVFHTSKGFFGVGPACMKNGDLVVLLCGGCHPYVVRPMPDGGGYLFLGGCYIDDIPSGKVDVSFNEANLEVFEFH